VRASSPGGECLLRPALRFCKADLAFCHVLMVLCKVIALIHKCKVSQASDVGTVGMWSDAC